ncbi:MAG: hypothetical protein Q4A31_00170 [Corynebacterium sp.]|uniref:hypothetical protein n=1 Tax=Corynebacterium sp. TaxID=1720 RepID=UPI0026DDAD84|nr:hypothetical protein [Corynebacterium sp.]MDO4760323.1 hypothetical protein [Corynebacterium sp.]
MQAPTDESGYPLWVSPVSPSFVQESPQRVSHVLNEIDSVDIHILANEGNIGAVHNVHTPIRGKNLVDDEYE